MLKNKLFLFTFICLAVIQVTNAQTFRGGIFAGFTASQIDGDKVAGYNRANFKMGIVSELKKKRRVPYTYGFELLYQGKGSNTEIISTPTSQSPDNRIRIHAVEILPYFRYFFTKGISARGGLALGYVLSADKKIEGEVADFEDGRFSKVTLEGNIGINAKIGKKLFFQVDFQYSVLSMANVINDGGLFNNSGQFNNIVGFTLYTFFN